MDAIQFVSVLTYIISIQIGLGIIIAVIGIAIGLMERR